MKALVLRREVLHARPATTYGFEFVAIGTGITALMWWVGTLLM